jgi:hypothetical protein
LRAAIKASSAKTLTLLPVASDIDSNREIKGHIRMCLPAVGRLRRSPYRVFLLARLPAYWRLEAKKSRL